LPKSSTSSSLDNSKQEQNQINKHSLESSQAVIQSKRKKDKKVKSLKRKVLEQNTDEESPKEQREELDCNCTKHSLWGNHKVRSPRKRWISNTTSNHFIQNVIHAMKLARLLDGPMLCESCYGYFRET